MKRFPKSLNILGTKYTIKVGAEIDDSEHKGEEGLWGLCDKEEKIIHIKLHDKEGNNLDTLLHEVFHACAEEYNMARAIGLNDRVEEYLSECIAKVYSDVFKAIWDHAHRNNYDL